MNQRKRKKPFIWTYVVVVLAVLLGAYVYSTRPEKDTESKVLVALSENELKQLVVDKSDESIVLEKAEDDWKIVIGSRRFDTDTVAVNDMLSSLSNLEFTREVASGVSDADLGQYGLDSPEVAVLASTEDSTIEIKFGDRTPVGSDRYVAVSSLPGQVFTVASNHYNVFNRKRDDVRNKNVVSVATHELAEIAVTNANQQIRVKKSGEDWHLVSPYQDLADYYSASNLVWTASSLTADEFVNDDPETLAPYGLDQPRATVEFISSSSEEGGKRSSLTLYIGSEVEDGSGFYFMTDKSSSVYKSNRATAPFVSLTVNDLLETSIFTKTRTQLAKLTVAKDGQQYAMVSKDDEWIAILPSGDEVTMSDTDALNAWYDFQRIKIKEIAADKYQGLTDEELGLASTGKWVTADWKDGTVTKVLFGSPVGPEASETQLVLCKVSDRPYVYVADLAAFEEVVTALANAKESE